MSEFYEKKSNTYSTNKWLFSTLEIAFKMQLIFTFFKNFRKIIHTKNIALLVPPLPFPNPLSHARRKWKMQIIFQL